MSDHEVPTIVPKDRTSDSSVGESNVKPAIAVASAPPPPAPIRTPEITSASPSLTPWTSSSVYNTTPRQSGKRFIPEERKSSVSNSSRGSIGSNASSRTITPSTIATSALEAVDVIPPLNYPSMMPTISPKPPSQCSLYCCFYAEFDIKVGPMICYQSPRNFMEQDIRSTSGQWETLLAETFATLQLKDTATDVDPCVTSTPKATGGARAVTSSEPESNLASDVVQPEDPALQSYSIFDSCSEYIITGSELTGNIINLSTHNIHLVTRPTVIVDESYERNSLLFCVGFVLRRADDPQPYRPLLSKLALTLRDMEIESQFLSQSREKIQPMLEGILLSLNSPNCECNMLLGAADILNLKLFRPPRTPALPVKDHSVPILLRRDWHQQAYEWDISINWVSLHIDGIANVRQISKKAEVDLEMVRACLRVLKHHGFVALVDMFCYSNRYECTGCVIGSSLLQEAAEYVIKRSASDETVASASDMALHGGNLLSDPGHLDRASPWSHSSGKDSSPVSYSFMSSFPLETAIKGDSYSDRFGVGAGISFSQSRHETPLASFLKHEDILEVKTAIVEFFSACHRGVTIGELWISFVSKRLHSFSGQVPWNKMFRMIDHRRLVTFGLLHGLIRRVHNFLLLRDRQSYIDREGGDRYPVFVSLDRMKLGQHSHMIQTDFQRLMSKAATLLDGVHIDDEIVCSIEVPIDDIIAMFPENSVVSVLACG